MKNIESEIYKYLAERGWDKLRPSDLAKSICIEAAELLEIFQWTSISLEEAKQDLKKMEEIKKGFELTGIDFSEEMIALEKNAFRPADFL